MLEAIWGASAALLLVAGLVGTLTVKSDGWFAAWAVAFLLGVGLLISGAIHYSGDDGPECELGQVKVEIEDSEGCFSWSEVEPLLVRMSE